VPTQLAAGTTQAFTITVTNTGGQPSTAGTISFNNSDGSLLVQGPVQQALGALAPGASATFTWQVEAMTPPNPDFGSVFQVLTTAGDGQTFGFSDQVAIG